MLALPATGSALDVDLATQFAGRFDGAVTNASTGLAVASAGDVNGDGYDDVIVGSTDGHSAYQSGYGQANVFYGAPAMPIIDLDTWVLIKPSRARGFSVGGSNAVQRGIGNAVSGAGDVNGDGYDDVIIGAPSTQYLGRTASGASYVLYGGPNLNDRQVPPTSNGFTIEGALANDAAGTSVASAGDVNGDGFDDLIVGAPKTDNNGRTDAGSAYVLYGGTSLSNVDLSTALPAAQGFRIDGATAGDHLGQAVAGVGDVNHDGFDDVVVGAPAASPFGRAEAGSVYVIYGAAQQSSPELVNGPSAARGFRIDGGTADDDTGSAVAPAGDFNGDGFADIAVGASGFTAQAGAAYVLYGATAPSTIDLGTGPAAARGIRIDGAAQGDQTGAALSAGGDINDDGYDDLLVAAAAAPGPNDAGTVSVVYGAAAPTAQNLGTLSPLQGVRIVGGAMFDQAGYGVGGGGDVDGDGRPDVIVGAPGGDLNARSQSGSAYVVSADFLPAVAYDGHVATAVGAPLTLAPTRLSASPVATLAISPALPDGLAFDAATGRVTGTPTAIGESDYTVTVTDPRRGVAHAAFHLAVVGATGPQGAPGPAGPAGTAGAQGPAGAKGAKGKDGKVTCKVTGKKRKPKVTCKVKKAGRHAVLRRHGRVYARGSARHLRAVRALRPGRYVLEIGSLRVAVRLS